MTVPKSTVAVGWHFRPVEMPLERKHETTSSLRFACSKREREEDHPSSICLDRVRSREHCLSEEGSSHMRFLEQELLFGYLENHV